jgi:hypothetical protein
MTTDSARFRSGMRSFMAGLLDVEVVRDEPDVADEPDAGVPQLRRGKSQRIPGLSCGNGAEPGDGSCH